MSYVHNQYVAKLYKVKYFLNGRHLPPSPPLIALPSRKELFLWLPLKKICYGTCRGVGVGGNLVESFFWYYLDGGMDDLTRVNSLVFV